MRAKHVGDAKDFAKAFLFRLLRDKQPVHFRLKVLPFFTSDDGGEDVQAVRATYASILGCTEDEILLGNSLFSNNETERSTYIKAAIEQLGEADTLFLDPDTGVRHGLWNPGTTKYARNQEYVTYDDLTTLLKTTAEASRILIVYDEAYSRGSLRPVAKAMICKLESLRKEQVTGFGYYGNAVNLLFLANLAARRRLEQIREILTIHLGTRADRIITL